MGGDAILKLSRTLYARKMTYTVNLTRISDRTLWIGVLAEYRLNSREAYATFNRSFIAEDSESETGLGISHATETGVIYALDYFNRIEDSPSVLPGIAVENKFEFSATYSF